MSASGQAMRLLVLTYHFPPSNATGTFRILGFVRHLERCGWACAIVTVRDAEGDPIDPSLLPMVPAETLVRRTPAPDVLRTAASLLQRMRSGRSSHRLGARDPGDPAHEPWRPVDYLSRFLVTPDAKIGWIPFAAAAALRLARTFEPHAILSSGPPWSAHRAALRAARRLGVPWAADFRDPWAVSPFAEIPYPSLARRNARFEAEVIRGAALVVCNTDALEASFRTRYPEEPASKFVTITNGYDPEDFEGVEPSVPPPGRLRLLHAGVLYGRRDPEGLLQALEAVRDAHPEVARALDVRFVGFLREERFDMEALARERRLDGIVSGEGSVGHRDALALMLGADALLVLGVCGCEPETQVPAKVYEYLGANRFIVSLSQPEGAIARVLRQSGRPHVVVPLDDPAAICETLVSLHARWVQRELRPQPAGSAELTPFTRSALTARLASALSGLTGGGPIGSSARAAYWRPDEPPGAQARSKIST